jgi:NifB/MoaA-like Fe-S oxidoreductase
VWNEPSAGIALAALEGETPRLPSPAVVATVEPGSIAEELGFQPGDRLLSINGRRPRDLIDLQMLVGEEELTSSMASSSAITTALSASSTSSRLGGAAASISRMTTTG